MRHLICPVCASTLALTESHKSLQCEHQHLFDLAKKGYANLLLSQNKKSKNPGDTSEMVLARTEFLDRGYYQGIAQTFEDLTLQHLSNTDISYCDLACGEGYYTSKLHQKLKARFTRTTTTGIDISTPAIKAACNRDKEIQWLVASTSRIPLESDSQDLVSGLFFHFDLKEIQRILKPKGIAILVNTGPNHLIELRKAVYDELKEEKGIQIINNTESLRHHKTECFQQKISLNNTKEILQLLAMTPHYWRAKPEKKNALSTLTKLDLTLDVQFDLFIKTTK